MTPTVKVITVKLKLRKRNYERRKTREDRKKEWK
jgi:hypothetical protein